MKHYYNKILMYSIFVILIILLSSIFLFIKLEKEDNIISLSDVIVNDFRKGLDYEMVDLLSFSMALSEDGGLRNTLISNNEKKCYEILNHLSKRFKKYTHIKSLRIQVLTKDFFIFARSWNEGFEGMPIWWFRDDLDKLKKLQEPKVGMETGRLLTFKSTIPIKSGNKILGYLEVIKFVDEFGFKLRNKGIELFALMNDKYLKQAELMRDFPQINGLVVSNQNYNHQLIDKIQKIHWKNLISKKYIYKNNTLYILEPMINNQKVKIGFYLLVISKETLKKYTIERQKTSLLTQFSNKDIENVIKNWQNPSDSFRNIKDKDLIRLLPNLQADDKKELQDKARDILKKYTKKELINIILSIPYKEKKKGQIR